MNSARFLAVFVAAATGLRWWWQSGRPLSPEESYLALCGFIPSIAYFDGPGGTPWLVALGIYLVGPGGLGAAFFWPVLAAMSSVALYLLVSSLTNRAAGLAVAVLLNLLPVFNAAALAPTCAMPLTASAVGALVCAWYALEKDSSAWWMGAGLCVAAGLLFSYVAWFLLPAIALVLLASHRWRRRMLSPGFLLAWISPLAVLYLLLQWNAQHGWVHFIGGTLKTALAVHPFNLGSGLMSAAEALSPLVLVSLLTAAFSAAPLVVVSPKIKFVFLPGLAALLVAFYTSLRGLPALAPGLLAACFALPLLAWLPAQLGRFSMRAVVGAVFLTAALWCAATLPRPDRHPLIDARIGQRIGDLRDTQAQADAQPPLLIAENAPLAAALALALPEALAAAPGHPPVYTVESAAARSQFDLWPRYDQFVETSAASTPDPALDPFTEQDGANPFIGRDALFATMQGTENLPQAITAAFTHVRLLEEIPTPDGQILRLYLCSDYQTMPL